MADLTANLTSFSFEAGLSEEEKKLLYLRSRSAALTVSGCAHAVFVSELIICLRKKLNAENGRTSKSHLSVGVLGGGHVGKQLAQALLQTCSLRPRDVNISSRRPETLGEFSSRSVECYFDNIRLAQWADLLFLCVLPAHLPRVCADIRPHLSSDCLVYSFTSAVPLTKLAMLLDHSFIIKPQYSFVACDPETTVWHVHNRVSTALKNKEVLSATFPLSMYGGLLLDGRWASAVLYALLNICTAQKLNTANTLQLLNELFHTQTFTYASFVTLPDALELSEPDNLFPWINLVDAQTKDTPLTEFVSGNKALTDSISVIYYDVFSKLEDK